MNQRPRRNRKSAAIRALVRETRLSSESLILPLFIADYGTRKKELTHLPENFIWPADDIFTEIERCLGLGIQSFMLFPKVPADKKDTTGTYGYHPENFYLRAVKEIKQRFPEVCLISDVALDPYNVDGHDGIVRNGIILNDETLAVLRKLAVAQAEAGFDILGPSDMMDGRVKAIRDALDKKGYTHTSIMSYTAKYASAFYGPFRDALDSAPVSDPSIPKDKKTYQMDPANHREAMTEARLDIREGADFLMVKPALHYLDIIHKYKRHFDLPVAAYHVSGECAMLIAAVQQGWLDFDDALHETLTSIHRAGADIIITYFAKQYAEWLRQMK